METILEFLSDNGIITAILATLGALLTAGLVKLRKYIKETPNQLDDAMLETFEDALRRSKEDKNKDDPQ